MSSNITVFAVSVDLEFGVHAVCFSALDDAEKEFSVVQEDFSGDLVMLFSFSASPHFSDERLQAIAEGKVMDGSYVLLRSSEAGKFQGVA